MEMQPFCLYVRARHTRGGSIGVVAVVRWKQDMFVSNFCRLSASVYHANVSTPTLMNIRAHTHPTCIHAVFGPAGFDMWPPAMSATYTDGQLNNPSVPHSYWS